MTDRNNKRNGSEYFTEYFTVPIARSYHAYAESDLFMDRRQSVLHDYAYFRLVAWLEENIVPGK